MTPASEPAELARFREQWQAEVRQRKTLASAASPSPSPSASASPTAAHPAPSLALASQRSPNPDAAVLRRQPDDPNIYRACFEEEDFSPQQPKTSSASTVDVDGDARVVQKPSAHHDRRDDPHATTGFLAQVLEKFPERLAFEPDVDDGRPPFSLIPDELVLQILQTLDYSTIERFAAVSRKARVLSLDPAIWRHIVHLTYKPPQIPTNESISDIVARYNSDYRRVYVEHPRLRLDGVYIAVCHYVRMGASENAWVNISHLITYHRYLRFFPNGQVLSLRADEESQPQIVIPLLKPSLRKKGFYIGNWSLSGSTVYITNLTEKHPMLATAERQPSKYVFQMTLALRSRPLGRWNKLDFIGYDSVNVEDGEAMALPLKHDRSFWFSKVRSWPGC